MSKINLQPWVDLVLMTRNRAKSVLTKAERKRMKEGTTAFHADPSQAGKNAVRAESLDSHVCRDTRGLAPQRHSQTSDNSWVHAVGFVILAAIVISWALGY